MGPECLLQKAGVGLVGSWWGVSAPRIRAGHADGEERHDGEATRQRGWRIGWQPAATLIAEMTIWPCTRVRAGSLTCLDTHLRGVTEVSAPQRVLPLPPRVERNLKPEPIGEPLW